jgi:hypothetical protein
MTFTLVGDCCIHSIMEGDIMKTGQLEDPSLRTWFDIEPRRLYNIESARATKPESSQNIFSLPEKPELARSQQQAAAVLRAGPALMTDATERVDHTSAKSNFDTYPYQFHFHWTWISFETLFKTSPTDSR